MLKFCARKFGSQTGKLSTILPVYNRSGNEYPFLESEWMNKGNMLESSEIVPLILSHKEVGSYFRNTDRELKECLIAGRSNVGKSTLINSLTKKKISDSSKTPGKTRNLYLFDMPQIGASLVDSPGYGYAKAGHEERENWKDLMAKYFKFSKTLYQALVLIDAVKGVSKQDVMLFDMLETVKIPFALVLTKADKLTPQKLTKSFKGISQEISKYSLCSPFLHATAIKNTWEYGLKELRSNIMFSLYKPH